MGDATFRIPMHGAGGFASLDAILAVVDGAGLEWHLVDIEAIAKRDSGVDVLQLEEDVRARPGGLALTDAALRALARQIDQVIDCEILGLRAERPDASTPDVRSGTGARMVLDDDQVNMAMGRGGRSRPARAENQ